ncbi:MAG: 5'/3'-nucleotidase SurE [Pseudoflavonifractor sp.]|nr:5'/3'-nucleotidase SurE [Pseudoflavonifractor sp.]
MSEERPLIFITNDDGVDAPGLKALIDAVSGMGDVIAVAPAGPRSGQSSAITVGEPLRIRHHADYGGAGVYSVSGTPVDCVKLGMHALADRKPSMLLSGINHGSNSGNSVIYSGTMGAVMEGCMLGIPSVGFSLTHHSWQADFTPGLPWVTQISRKVLSSGLQAGVCLNVNIPARCEPVGVKVCMAALGRWTEEYKDYVDPTGQPFYFLTGKYLPDNPDDPSTDLYWLDRQYISVVPVRPDQTAADALPLVGSLLE